MKTRKGLIIVTAFSLLAAIGIGLASGLEFAPYPGELDSIERQFNEWHDSAPRDAVPIEVMLRYFQQGATLASNFIPQLIDDVRECQGQQ